MSLSSTTPLTSVQPDQFLTLTQSMNKEQLAWVSGYLAALSTQNPRNLED
ncbi:MAG: hypothetical protein WCP08_11920 [Prolixibacteraceae bacterium]